MYARVALCSQPCSIPRAQVATAHPAAASTRGRIPCHLGGLPCDTLLIVDIAKSAHVQRLIRKCGFDLCW
jgi:hypothetical protein